MTQPATNDVVMGRARIGPTAGCLALVAREHQEQRTTSGVNYACRCGWTSASVSHLGHLVDVFEAELYRILASHT